MLELITLVFISLFIWTLAACVKKWKLTKIDREAMAYRLSWYRRRA